MSQTLTAEDPKPQDPKPQATEAVIQLAGSGNSAGRLIDGRDPGHLNWQTPGFVSPFRFPVSAIAAIQFPVPKVIPQPTGTFCFEMVGGDVLYGELKSFAGSEATLEIPELGTLRVDRASLRRLFRWSGQGNVIYMGPNGLKDWTTSGPDKGWREEAGQLIAATTGATIFRDIGIPATSRIEFDLSWKSKPDFELALGTDFKERASTVQANQMRGVIRRANVAVAATSVSSPQPFRFEIWENELVAHREIDKDADLAALQSVAPGEGRIRLQVFLDQQKGRLLVMSAAGKELADLTVSPAKPVVAGGIQLINHSGDIRLERLRVSAWNGESPRSFDLDKARLHVADGTTSYGTLTSYDSKSREFTFSIDGESRTIKEDQVQDVVFSQDRPQEAAAKKCRAVMLNGQRISGDVVEVSGNLISFQNQGIADTVRVPIESLYALMGQPTADTFPPSSGGREGRFESEAVNLRGRFVNGRQADGGCLIWQPIHSTTASKVRGDASAKVVFRDPPPPPKPLTAQQIQQQKMREAQMQAQQNAGIVGQLQNLFGGGGGAATKKTTSTKKPILHLRSGDIVPCDVTAIDENGVHFTSPLIEAKFVPHGQLKAMELMPDAAPVQIIKSKRERLLVLPRINKGNPPTQLVRSVDGDYLRGRLLSMDAQQLQMEVRLENKMVPRDRVARVIWLHPDELPNGNKPVPAEDPDAKVRVQAIPSDGNRLTFYANEFKDNVLAGESTLLGKCHVDLQQIDQLLIGPMIEQAAAALAFHQWKLTAAAEPLEGNPDGAGGEGGSEGTESALVGKQAPDFELETLDGKPFKLSDRKSKIVILDFWASWCGPCLQAMPQVDRVAAEFADQGVELVAVNLEEAPERIKTALRRLKLDMPVALDRDGRVAEKYGATSIPQTVIIDRDGKVFRLYVGAGARFDDQLRTALNALLGNTPKAKDE